MGLPILRASASLPAPLSPPFSDHPLPLRGRYLAQREGWRPARAPGEGRGLLAPAGKSQSVTTAASAATRPPPGAVATHGRAGHGVLGGRLALAVLLLQLLDLLKGEEGAAAAGPLLWMVLHPLLKLLRVAALDMETQVLLVLGGEVAEVAAEGLPTCRGHQRLSGPPPASLLGTRGAAPPRPARNAPNCYLCTKRRQNHNATMGTPKAWLCPLSLARR